MHTIEKLDLQPLNQKERIYSTFHIKSEPIINQTIYKSSFGNEKFPTALTFDDVLLVPQYSDVESRSHCSASSYFSKNVPLNVPIVSSPMDTVTEANMAIGMAKEGGLGIIHRFMTI
jgi:hypothetical protein